MKKQKTTLVVRPAARGGKYLGKDAAQNGYSALIALADSNGKFVTGALAKASSKSSAGPDTLMCPVRRSEPFATDSKTVEVELSVAIDKPTDFTVMVFGPLSNLDQARLAQAQITLLPGVDIGTTATFPEGVVIEVPGLRINNVVTSKLNQKKLSCSAMVTMMCGCEIANPKTQNPCFWPYTDFDVQLVTYMSSGTSYSYPLEFDTTGSLPSTFSGSWQSKALKNENVVQAWLYASEPKLGNQGRYLVSPTSNKPFVPNLPPELLNLLKKGGILK